MNNSDKQREHFNKISEKYLSSRSGEKCLAYKEVYWEYIFKKFEDLVGSGHNLCGLDAMCGNAEIAEKFCSKYHGIKMSAFDYSEEMLASARKTTEAEIEIFQCDILKLSQNELYDFVILVGGLHHVPHDADLAVKNIYAALKPGGFFLSFEPTHNNFLWKWVRETIYKNNDLFEESTEQGFTLRDYNQLLIDNHFDIAHQFYPGLLGYVLYYNPDAFPLLNKGPVKLAKALCKSDLLLGNTFIGRLFSFSTVTFAIKK